MADLKISDLRPIGDVELDSIDNLPVADLSSNETRKISALNLAKAAIRLTPDGSIPYSKLDSKTLDIPDGSVTTDDLANGAVTNKKLASNDVVETAQIIDGAVTNQKLATPSVDTPQLVDGSVTNAKLALTDVVATQQIFDDAVTKEKLAASAYNKGIEKNAASGFVGHTNAGIEPGTAAGIEYDEHGHIIAVGGGIGPDDLPLATRITPGIVSVPVGSGLNIGGDGALTLPSLLAPGTSTKVTYNDQGIITAASALDSADIPIATTGTIGGVQAPGPEIVVDSNGNIELAPSGVIAGTAYTKFSVNTFGQVTQASTLNSGDIPNLSFDKITSGFVDTDQIADEAITSPKIDDYATCLMQEGNPGKGDFLGQLWFTPSTAQLRVFTRGSGPQNIWSPIGFGNLQANNLRWGGTYDADTNKIVNVTAIGTSEGLIAGDPFPVPTDGLSGLYLVCAVGGSNTTQPQLNGVKSSPGDWALCLDESQGWNHVDAAAGGGGGGGATFLKDLLDVELGGSAPFATGGMEKGSIRSALEDRNLFKYDSADGMWKNTNLIDCGSF